MEIEKLKELADSGDSYVLFELGKAYFYGESNTPIDQTKAIELLTISANEGFIEAIELLGDIFLDFNSKFYSINTAEYWFYKGAQLNSTYSIFHLAIIYKNTKNFEKEILWLNKGSELGDMLCKINLAFAYEEGEGVIKSLSSAKSLFKEVADLGSGENEEKLLYATFLLSNYGVSKEAIDYLFSSSKEGSKTATIELAKILLFNISFKNTELGINLLIDLIKNDNDGEALTLLGNYYFEIKNYNQATYYFEQGVDTSNNEEAKLGLYLLFKYGIIRGNKTKYLNYLKDAIAANLLRAKLEYGMLYEEGKLVKKNDKLALSLYRDVTLSGEPLGLLYKGNLLLDHVDNPNDLNKAFNCFVKLRELGYSVQNVKLASCYFYGNGTPKDRNKAIEILTSLVQNNDKEACNLLGIIKVESQEISEKKEAYTLFEKGASLGSNECLFNQALMLLDEDNPYYDLKVAFKFIISNCDIYFDDFFVTLSNNRFDVTSSLKNENLSFIKQQIKQVNLSSQQICFISKLLFYGIWLPKNKEMAFKILKDSLNNDNKENYNILLATFSHELHRIEDCTTYFDEAIKTNSAEALCKKALICTKDIDEKIKLLKKAYKNGYLLSSGYLAKLFYVQKNYKEAKKWSKIAFNDDIVDGINVLASLLLREGKYKDYILTLKNSASLGSDEANYELATILLTDNDDADNLSKAIMYLQNITDKAKYNVYYLLGYLYLKRNEPEDEKKSFESFKQGSLTSNKCRIELARCYILGIGVKPNFEIAKQLLFKIHNKKAKQLLDSIKIKA